MRCHVAAPCTSGRLSRASCTRFSPMSCRPAAMPALTTSAGKVFVTATSVTSSRRRPARAQAAAIRSSTAAALALICSGDSIDASSLHPFSVGAVDGEVRQAIGLFVAGAQRMTNREAAEAAGHRFCLLEKRNEVGMLHAVDAEHLLDEQLRVGNDLDFRRPFLL